MELIPCRVVESSCLPTHSIVPHTSLHDQPYHKTMKICENSQCMEVFQFLSRKIAIQKKALKLSTVFSLISHCL